MCLQPSNFFLFQANCCCLTKLRYPRLIKILRNQSTWSKYIYIYIYIFKFNWRVHEIKCIFSARNSWKISFIRHLVSWQNTTVLVNYYPLWLIHFVPLHLPWGPPWSFWLSWVPDVKATRNFCHLCWLRYFFSSTKFFTFSCWKFVSRCFCCPSRSTCGAA